jgi:hypothetical protein
LKEHLQEAHSNKVKNSHPKESIDIAKLNAELKKQDWQNGPDSDDDLPEEERRRKEEFRKRRAEHYKVPSQFRDSQ